MSSDLSPARPTSRSRRALLAVAAIVVLVAALLTGSFSHAPAAYGADYPSWEDVQAARANEQAKAAEIAKIQQLIKSLQDEVARTQAEAQKAGDEFYSAQQEYFEAARYADDLQTQADAQAVKAQAAAEKAGRVAAKLYRDGGDDTSLELFFTGSAQGADDLLARLGTMDKLIQRNQSMYADAITARNSAQSLSDQAKVARDERDRLQKIAEEKMIAAQQAADAATAALEAQEKHKVELDAQLAALQDTAAKTLAGYQAGVEAARKAEEERKAKERAAAEASRASGGGSVVSSGWARPSAGAHTSGYGPRSGQCNAAYCASTWHLGVDLSAGCGAGVYAASAGRVVFSGPTSGYGNYIKIDHGGGIGTGYGHNSVLYVRYGQWVQAGQLIAAEGQTGHAFGCHLHFEVYVPGGTTDPVPFMAARGIGV